jgi:hypothetical protein
MKINFAFAGRIKTGDTSSKIMPAGVPATICCTGDIPPEESQAETPAESGSVCAFCKNDFKGIILDKISAYPICDSCKVNLDKKIFPMWVKLFFAGVILIVVFSMFWNWRFYKGYIDIGKANRAFATGKVPEAASLMETAAADVPEAKDLVALASYFKAVDLYKKTNRPKLWLNWTNARACQPNFISIHWFCRPKWDRAMTKKITTSF